MATLDEEENRQKCKQNLDTLSFFPFPSKDKSKPKKSKKGVKIMETNIKRIFLANYENFENCYIFSLSIGRNKNVGGKTYRVTRYFNGNRDFETAMKELAAKQVNKTAR